MIKTNTMDSKINMQVDPVSNVLKWVLLITAILCFVVIIWGTVKTYQLAPPLPHQFVSTSGTVLMTEEDIVEGLHAGADEYLIKPIRLNEFVARVNALLRRSQIIVTENQQGYNDGYLNVDLHRRHVYVDGRKIHLTPTEFKLLATLLENAGRVVTQRDLLEQVWGREYINDIYYPRVYVSQLRRKVEPDPANPIYILTEHRIGYRFGD